MNVFGIINSITISVYCFPFLHCYCHDYIATVTMNVFSIINSVVLLLVVSSNCVPSVVLLSVVSFSIINVVVLLSVVSFSIINSALSILHCYKWYPLVVCHQLYTLVVCHQLYAINLISLALSIIKFYVCAILSLLVARGLNTTDDDTDEESKGNTRPMVTSEQISI